MKTTWCHIYDTNENDVLPHLRHLWKQRGATFTILMKTRGVTFTILMKKTWCYIYDTDEKDVVLHLRYL